MRKPVCNRIATLNCQVTFGIGLSWAEVTFWADELPSGFPSGMKPGIFWYSQASLGEYCSEGFARRRICSPSEHASLGHFLDLAICELGLGSFKVNALENKLGSVSGSHIVKFKLDNMTKSLHMVNNGSDMLDKILEVGEESQNMKAIRFDYKEVCFP
ncbi:hypothetical protein KIW84_070360 [Lathyrus oleraceus]|uniref:Uncharacterized protein n=1 Tax=Pisum sativum TaxID=3888 RepID=A0A9D4VFI8_PEA|nr:hypothetical protein KIW84_070360 [Pisum sativum]